MKAKTDNFDGELRSLLVTMADEGIHGAADGISTMVGERLAVSEPVLRRVAISEVPHVLGGPETEAVGIYLRVEGQISGQIMLIIPYEKALELADLVMGSPAGTTQSLGALERSALAELGNLTSAFFLNAVAASTGLGARLSPPAVMVDMVGAILDVLVASSDGLGESVLMIQATFLRGEREIQVEFWLIPDRSTLEGVARRE